MLAPCPTPKLEDHPSSAVRDCLFTHYPLTLVYVDLAVIKLDTVKFLGLYLDNHLSWKPHIDFLLHNLGIACFVRRRLSHVLGIDAIRTAYYSYFPSLIICGIVRSFTLASCLFYLLRHSCLCDILILACFIFICQLTDAGFVKCVYVCAYVKMTNELMGSSNQLLSDV